MTHKVYRASNALNYHPRIDTKLDVVRLYLHATVFEATRIASLALANFQNDPNLKPGRATVRGMDAIETMTPSSIIKVPWWFARLLSKPLKVQNHERHI